MMLKPYCRIPAGVLAGSAGRLVRPVLLVWLIVSYGADALAALPMLTDDTGTQGTGKFQMEVAGEYDRDQERFFGITTRESDYGIAAIFTAGVSENIDLAVGSTYFWNSSRDDLGHSSRVDGVGDTALVAKWRIPLEGGISLALKPFVTLPSGNDEKFLGSGKVDYGVFFITSVEKEPWAVHFNLGYTRNLNTIGERNDLWRVSAAVVYSVSAHWKVCADLGLQTNTDRTSETEPAYILAGFIYAPAENLELSLGIKQGLNNQTVDLAVIPGITWRF